MHQSHHQFLLGPVRVRTTRALAALALAGVAALAAWLTTALTRQPWTNLALVLASPLILRTAARDLRRRLDGTVTVKLHGEVGSRSAERAARRMAAALERGPSAVDIDMTRVTRLSRDGATALLAVVRAAHTAGVPVVVRGANAQARDTLHQLGLDRLVAYRPGQR
ncbi:MULTISPECIES: STAS domain-containing protein [unclassified Kitasatospora]|uniref:STAS domain-containing protein n=1 Tax=unclassified Kitasatospora TaxID=2633591 RepID=UPI0033DB4313